MHNPKDINFLRYAVLLLAALFSLAATFSVYTFLKIQTLEEQNIYLQQRFSNLQPAISKLNSTTNEQQQQSILGLQTFIEEQQKTITDLQISISGLQNSIQNVRQLLSDSRSVPISTKTQPDIVKLKVSDNIEEASYGGIGIMFDDSADISAGMVIKNTIPQKPAQKAGLKASDKILKIDGLPVNTITKKEAAALMRGPIGSTVKLSYTREEDSKTTKEVILTRELIEIATHVPSSNKQTDKLQWNLKGADTHFIISNNTDQNNDTKTFYIRNTGSAPEAIRDLKITDIIDQLKTTWEILPASTCVKDKTLPPATDCSVVVRAKPVMDGQINSVIKIYADNDLSSNVLFLGGYAQGVAGTLNDGILGNGSPCPSIGTPAEVAVSATGRFNSNDGYFNNLNQPYAPPSTA